MAYSLYINGVLFPVTPDKIQTKISNQNKTVKLINDAEINILKKPGLSELSCDLLLPAYQYPFAVYPDGFQDAKYFLDILEALKTDQSNFRFIITRTTPGGGAMFDTNIQVSLEDYIITEDAKEGQDVTVQAKFKQYVEYGTKTVVVKAVSTGSSVQLVKQTTKRQGTKKTGKTYTVKSGDTLWKIAKQELGDGGKYAKLAKLNNIAHPNKLTVGQVLRLG